MSFGHLTKHVIISFVIILPVVLNGLLRPNVILCLSTLAYCLTWLPSSWFIFFGVAGTKSVAWRHPPAPPSLPFTGRTVFLFKAPAFDDVAAVLLTPPPPVIQSPALGLGEGSGKGEDVGGGSVRDNGDSASEGEIPAFSLGVSPKLSTGSGEHDHASRANIQERIKAEENNSLRTFPSDQQALMWTQLRTLNLTGVVMHHLVMATQIVS